MPRSTIPDAVKASISAYVKDSVDPDGICRVNYRELAAHLLQKHGVTLGDNTLIGQVHRSRKKQGLTAPPSHIFRKGSKGRTARERPAQKLPKEIPYVPTVVVEVPIQAPVVAIVEIPQPPAPVEPPDSRPIPAPQPTKVVSPTREKLVRVITCQWPIGEPGTRSFRFCDSASESGKPYCKEHAKLAYVKVRDRREDAA